MFFVVEGFWVLGPFGYPMFGPQKGLGDRALWKPLGILCPGAPNSPSMSYESTYCMDIARTYVCICMATYISTYGIIDRKIDTWIEIDMNTCTDVDVDIWIYRYACRCRIDVCVPGATAGVVCILGALGFWVVALGSCNSNAGPLNYSNPR